MTEAEAAIADLDAALADVGEDVELQRITIGPGGAPIPFKASCRAMVRGYSPQELGGGIMQGDSLVILSPTDIERAQWPGGQAVTQRGDARVPGKDDKVLMQGRQRNVEGATPFYVGGVLVRVELSVRG